MRASCAWTRRRRAPCRAWPRCWRGVTSPTWAPSLRAWPPPASRPPRGRRSRPPASGSRASRWPWWPREARTWPRTPPSSSGSSTSRGPRWPASTRRSLPARRRSTRASTATCSRGMRSSGATWPAPSRVPPTSCGRPSTTAASRRRRSRRAACWPTGRTTPSRSGRARRCRSCSVPSSRVSWACPRAASGWWPRTRAEASARRCMCYRRISRWRSSPARPGGP